MLSLGSPSSQTASSCPISFVLDDAISGSLDVVTLAIRPEDLSRQDPSRLTVQQTLGGAWADSFGAGLAQISISGTTGWHRMYGTGRETPGQQEHADGQQRFQQLRDTVFDQWHDRRARAVSAGLDPNGVRLIFADGLHDTTSLVAPVSFVLRRSRSRPLLTQYQISMVSLGPVDMTVLVPTLPSLLDFVARGPLQAAGLKSLADSSDKILGYIAQVSAWIAKNIAGPVQAFMRTTASIYASVMDGVASINGVADQLILVARDISRAGMNVFHSIAAIANLPAQIKARVIDVAAAYRNAFCTLRNALSGSGYYEDFNPLYGASNCSSTAGGSAISAFRGLNTFAETVIDKTGGILVSTVAQASLGVLASTDVVTAPLSLATIGPLTGSVAGGVALP